MVEARKRNPDILLSGLAWTFPGWVGVGTSSPWTNATVTAGYFVAWLRGARDVYNITLDYLNADMNERGWNAAFVKELRVAMDAAGFTSTKLVCGDDAHVFSCAATAASDPSLRDIIVALGSHGPTVCFPFLNVHGDSLSA